MRRLRAELKKRNIILLFCSRLKAQPYPPVLLMATEEIQFRNTVFYCCCQRLVCNVDPGQRCSFTLVSMHTVQFIIPVHAVDTLLDLRSPEENFKDHISNSVYVCVYDRRRRRFIHNLLLVFAQREPEAAKSNL